MIQKLAVAFIIGAIAWLVCIGLGILLAALGIPGLSDLGKFFTAYAIPIGAVAGLLAFFTGWSPFGPRV